MEIEALADHLDQGLVLIGDAGVEYENRRCAEILGHPYSASPPFQLSRLADRIRSSGGQETIDIENDGRTLHVCAIALAGGLLVMLLRDDTRVHHLETVRRDFVANVSHELRTPIAAISLIVETLNNGALEDLPAAHEFVDRIGLEVSNLNQMVEELLALARMESSSETDFEREQVPLGALVEALGRLQPLLAARKQNLVIDIAGDTPAIYGNPRLLEQLFRNLVHNASKYSPDDADIRLEARRDGTHVVVRVIDRGIGIAPEDVSRIFERFWKADRSRQRDGEGNGLGLAIVRHAVEVHGGTVTVESVPQHGSTFTVTLPSATG